MCACYNSVEFRGAPLWRGRWLLAELSGASSLGSSAAGEAAEECE